MTEPFEQAVRDRLIRHEVNRPRSMQVETGASQVLGCTAAAMFRLRGETPDDGPVAWQAMVGTQVHALMADIFADPSGRYVVEERHHFDGLPATVDLYDTLDKVLTDWKTKDDAAKIALAQEDEVYSEHAPQLMLGAAALRESGHDVEQVRIVMLPRSGQFTVRQFGPWPYDEKLAREARDWSRQVDDLAANQDADPTTYREKPPWWCARFCEYFRACRGGAELTLDELSTIAEEYLAHKEIAEAAEAAMKDLRPLLEGQKGRAGRVALSSSWIPEKVKDVPDLKALLAEHELAFPDLPVPTVEERRSGYYRVQVRWAD